MKKLYNSYHAYIPYKVCDTAFSALYNQEMDSWNFWIFFVK